MSPHRLAPSARPPHVLVVDDEELMRGLVAKRMASLGAEVDVAEDGAAGWASLQSGSHFDLVVTDLEMPTMDGVALITKMRAHPLTKNVPVIVLTSREGASAIEKALAAGATSFIKKPLNWSLFGSYVSHLLSLAVASRTLLKHDPDASAGGEKVQPCSA